VNHIVTLFYLEIAHTAAFPAGMEVAKPWADKLFPVTATIEGEYQ
jgi:hypothetical protein